jgi:hypothetical protein
MSNAEELWRRKSDDELLAAAASLDEYTEEGRQVIVAEANRRRLNVAPILRTTAQLAATSSDSRRCAYCDTWIMFGGNRLGQLRFCTDSCRQSGIQLSASHEIPDHVVNERVWSVFNGICPKCGGPGPVDVHRSHRVVSALVVTSSNNRLTMSCRSCANKEKIRDTLLTFGLGWWGVPWGVIMTPIQIGRNLTALFSRSGTGQPSTHLQKLVRLKMFEELVAGPPTPALEPKARR